MTEKEAIELLVDSYIVDFAGDTDQQRMALEKFLISILEEIQQYRAIGTVEECRSAVEKQKAKKPNFEYMLGNWEARYRCPICNKVILHDCRDMGCSFCDKCGQKLDRSEEE